MGSYEIGLFVHVSAALSLFMAIAVSQTAFGGVRSAATASRLRLWLGVARRVSVVFPISIAVLLGSGMFLTAQAWSFSTPWVATSIGGVVVLSAVGGSVSGRHARGIADALGTATEGRLPPEVTALQARRAPMVASYAVNGLAVGIVFLMTTKPGWAGAVLGVICAAAAGGVLGALMTRRRTGQPGGRTGAPAPGRTATTSRPASTSTSSPSTSQEGLFQ